MCAVSSISLRSLTPWLSPGGSRLDGDPSAQLWETLLSHPSVSNAYGLKVILGNDQLEMSVLEKLSRKIQIKSKGKGQTVS